MRNVLPAIAFFLILTMALVADSLMDTVGPSGFIKVAGGILVATGLLLLLSDRAMGKRKPPAGGGSSNGRQHQCKH